MVPGNISGVLYPGLPFKKAVQFFLDGFQRNVLFILLDCRLRRASYWNYIPIMILWRIRAAAGQKLYPRKTELA